MKICFDFDGTLSGDKPINKDVRRLFRKFNNEGLDVYILTSRYNELLKENYLLNPTNKGLWEFCSKLHFPREKVIFTNMKPKWQMLNSQRDRCYLIDDTRDEVNGVNENSFSCVAYMADEAGLNKFEQSINRNIVHKS